MFKYYKPLRRHIIYIEGKSVSERVSSFYYHIPKSICHFMYPFKYHLRRHIILGEWERIARVAPKAASNRYPYLFSHCCRAQMFKYYKLLCRHIIYTKGKSVSERVSSFYYHIPKSICHFMYPFKYHLRRHIILGEWERAVRVVA